MLGLVGTVAGAAALEFKRLRKRGSVEEVKEYKKKERELRQMLEATNLELEKVKQQSDIKLHELEAQLEAETVHLKREKAELEHKTAELDQQKVQLQQNNSKLVLANLMLMNKAKSLEEHTRGLVAKQEDLQHQLEQLQRDQQAAETSFEVSLAALKEQVTGVLNRYFCKDIDLQQAMSEMQALGIEVVSMDELHRNDNTMEFETKLVLDSPHRMQRLMCAAANGPKTLQLPSMAHKEDMPKVPQLAFPLGISKDPTTGAPRITLGWRADAQAAGALPAPAASDSHQAGPDQKQAVSKQAAPLAIKDTASTDTIKANTAKASSSVKVARVQEGANGAALTFASPQKQNNAGFSLGFGFGRRPSSSGGSNGNPTFDGAALLSTTALKSDDDMFLTASTKDLVQGSSR